MYSVSPYAPPFTSINVHSVTKSKSSQISQVGAGYRESAHAVVSETPSVQPLSACHMTPGCTLAHVQKNTFFPPTIKSTSTASHVSSMPNGLENGTFYSNLLGVLPIGAGRLSQYLPHAAPPVQFDHSMTSHPYGMMYAGLDLNGLNMRKAATRETTGPLKAWLHEHRKNPYPTKAEKIMLAIITKMTLTQVSTWFANARRRLKKESRLYSTRDVDDLGDHLQVKSDNMDSPTNIQNDAHSDSDVNVDVSDFSDSEESGSYSSASTVSGIPSTSGNFTELNRTQLDHSQQPYMERIQSAFHSAMLNRDIVQRSSFPISQFVPSMPLFQRSPNAMYTSDVFPVPSSTVERPDEAVHCQTYTSNNHVENTVSNDRDRRNDISPLSNDQSSVSHLCLSNDNLIVGHVTYENIPSSLVTRKPLSPVAYRQVPKSESVLTKPKIWSISELINSSSSSSLPQSLCELVAAGSETNNCSTFCMSNDKPKTFNTGYNVTNDRGSPVGECKSNNLTILGRSHVEIPDFSSQNDSTFLHKTCNLESNTHVDPSFGRCFLASAPAVQTVVRLPSHCANRITRSNSDLLTTPSSLAASFITESALRCVQSRQPPATTITPLDGSWTDSCLTTTDSAAPRILSHPHRFHLGTSSINAPTGFDLGVGLNLDNRIGNSGIEYENNEINCIFNQIQRHALDLAHTEKSDKGMNGYALSNDLVIFMC